MTDTTLELKKIEQHSLDRNDAVCFGNLSLADRSIDSDITVYGASGAVGRHVLTYLMQRSLSIPGNLRITVAGRVKERIDHICSEFSSKVGNLQTIYPNSSGHCTFDPFYADVRDTKAIRDMVTRTRVIVSCAGPFRQCGTSLVDACATIGVDYVDITGEVSWVAEMRSRFGEAAALSGARIISLCGFDSVPSDIAVFAAVEALRESFSGNMRTPVVEIDTATTYHVCLGPVPPGTIRTIAELSINFRNFFRKVPFLIDDPLLLTYPKVRFDPDMDDARNRMAAAEWRNLLPSIHSNLNLGVSAPLGMAIVNAKVIQASAVALKYGTKFVYQERYLPTGVKATSILKLIGIIPVLIVQIGLLLVLCTLKLPFIGLNLVEWLAPSGSLVADEVCRSGCADVFAEVTTPVDEKSGCVSRANVHLKFKGDPGFWVTSQCVAESALSLIFNRDELPHVLWMDLAPLLNCSEESF